MWSRTFCCCAIPLYNVGVYAILSQFTIISLVTAVLIFATPDIISVSLPDFAKYILAALCLIVTVIQIFGFLGVFRDNIRTFTTYTILNATAVLITLLVAVALIGVSASRHSRAKATCELTFSSQSGTQVMSASDVCNIWTWVQIGIMAGLWLLLLITELYFILYTSIYSQSQKRDHDKYEAVVTDAIEEIRQSGMWDNSTNRPSAEYNRYLESNQAPPRPSQSGLRNEVPIGGKYDIQRPGDEIPTVSSDGKYLDAYQDDPYYSGSSSNPPYGYNHNQDPYGAPIGYNSNAQYRA